MTNFNCYIRLAIVELYQNNIPSLFYVTTGSLPLCFKYAKPLHNNKDIMLEKLSTCM